MEKQEQQLLEGYRKLRPESKQLIMATVMGAVSATAPGEAAVKRQQGLAPGGKPAMPLGKDKALG